jgi:GNAT superfamily N-acetyltransferase
MQPGYTLRYATIDDAEIMTHFRRRMFEDMNYTEYTQSAGIDACYLDWVRVGLAGGSHVAWLLVHEGQPVGSTGIELSNVQPHAVTLTTRRAHVVNVYVEPEHRRRGLARRLMQTALDWCESEGIRVVTLQASDEGRPLYESLGFKATREMILVR